MHEEPPFSASQLTGCRQRRCWVSPGGAGELLCPRGVQVFKARLIYLGAPGPWGRSASAQSSGFLRLQLSPQLSHRTMNPKYPGVCLTGCGGAWQRSPSSGTRSPRRGEMPAAASWLRRPPAARPGLSVLPASPWHSLSSAALAPKPAAALPQGQDPQGQDPCPDLPAVTFPSRCTKPASRGAVQLTPSLPC